MQPAGAQTTTRSTELLGACVALCLQINMGREVGVKSDGHAQFAVDMGCERAAWPDNQAAM